MLVRILLLSLLLGGCASKHQSFSPMDHHPMIEAKPNKNDGTSVAHFDEYIVPNNPAPDAVLTSSGFGNSPALVATYQKYLASTKFSLICTFLVNISFLVPLLVLD